MKAFRPARLCVSQLSHYRLYSSYAPLSYRFPSRLNSYRSLPSIYSRHSFGIRSFTTKSAEGTGISKEKAQKRVLEVVKNFHKVDAAKVTEKAHLTNDLGLDSLDQVELVLALEDEFAIIIPEEDSEKFRTVEEVIDYVAQHPNSK